MKATEQYFPLKLFNMLYKVFEHLSLWIKSSSVTIQMKATEQYFPVALCISGASALARQRSSIAKEIW